MIVHGGDLVCFIDNLQKGMAEIKGGVEGNGGGKKRKLDAPAGGG